MRIMLVDDSRKHRESGMVDLTACGHEVVTFRSYAEAIKSSGGGFDIALVDLLMPAEGMTLGEKGMSHFGEPFPVGYPLSIYLAKKGIQKVIVATDSNHHDHPASAIMDYVQNVTIGVGTSTVVWMHAPMKQDGTKDWVSVLERAPI